MGTTSRAYYGTIYDKLIGIRKERCLGSVLSGECNILSNVLFDQVTNVLQVLKFMYDSNLNEKQEKVLADYIVFKVRHVSEQFASIGCC